ncbi:MAG: hypothetical protein LBC76_06650 [Treponema sp.]|jgi:hypothetical protein|nr:hypothetical protein [Treponema sp.]
MMKKTIILLTLMAVALAAGMLFVSCKQSPEEEQRKALDGTWVNIEETSYDKIETTYTFNNGNYEVQHQWTSKTSPSSPSIFKIKGTCTTSGSLLTMVPTHEWGPIYGSLNEEKWYSISEIKQAYKDNFGSSWTAEYEKSFEEEYGPQTTAFSVSGSTLYIGDEKYTKK